MATHIAAHRIASTVSSIMNGSSLARPFARPAPAANLNPDWRPRESEFSTQLVHQKALVGEMEGGRNVGEEDEGWRRCADLRRVQNAHVLAAGADRRMRR